MKSGIELIAEERQRQIEQEGYTATHDDEHDCEELAYAAMYYAMPGYRLDALDAIDDKGIDIHLYPSIFFLQTGWELKFAKRTGKTRIQQLTAAGALIAAEIDRLQRQERER